VRAGDFLFLSLGVACGGSEPRAPHPQAARASVAAPAPSARVSNVEAVVSRMRQSFRECYQIGLWNNPNQGGSIRLVLKIDGRGRPASVTTIGGAGLDRMVVGCLVGVARRGSFAPSTGNEGSIEIPIAFASEGAALDAGIAADASPRHERD
jgi:hypothetical protein